MTCLTTTGKWLSWDSDPGLPGPKALSLACVKVRWEGSECDLGARFSLAFFPKGL